jgi:hypothetical protein
MSDWRDLFSKEELEWFITLGKAIHDPKDKRDFFDATIELKRANPSFSLFETHPREAPKETKPQDESEPARLARIYATPIIQKLKGILNGVETVETENNKQV